MAADLKTVLEELQQVLEAGTSFGAPAPWGGTDGGWRGMYGGLPNIPDPGQAWPYRTNAAERVWDIARQLLPQYPELDGRQVLRMAIEKAGVSALELTPEDWRLLEMAVQFERNGMRHVAPIRTNTDEKPRMGASTGSVGPT